MCEKCGFSGCHHDWKKWQPKHYSRGYADAANDLPANPPELMLGNSGYMSGYEQCQRETRHNLAQREVDECHCNAEHAYMTYIPHDKDCPARNRKANDV